MVKGQKNQNDDRFIDSLLRPNRWADYIGQEKIKKNLRLILEAAKRRNESSDHLLFYGPAGLGKTTLAVLAAKEIGGNLKTVSGSNLMKTGDLAAVLSDLDGGDILFVDEAHRIGSAVEEMLYSAMDNRKISVMIGKGPSGRLLSIDLPPFTLIAATTRPNLLSSPLRSRFGAAFRLDYYELSDVEEIIKRSAKILKIKILPVAILMISKASRFTPRLANRLLKRCRDFVEVYDHEIIDEKTVSETFNLLEIDALGLEHHDRRLLEIIVKKFKGGPVGINTLSAALGEEKGAIEEVYEPHLVKMGFIQRTPKGRMVSKAAYEHLQLQEE